MIARIKQWIRDRKLALADKWADEAGLTLAHIKTVAGSDYILRDNAQWVAIGRHKK